MGETMVTVHAPPNRLGGGVRKLCAWPRSGWTLNFEVRLQHCTSTEGGGRHLTTPGPSAKPPDPATRRSASKGFRVEPLLALRASGWCWKREDQESTRSSRSTNSGRSRFRLAFNDDLLVSVSRATSAPAGAWSGSGRRPLSGRRRRGSGRGCGSPGCRSGGGTGLP